MGGGPEQIFSPEEDKWPTVTHKLYPSKNVKVSYLKQQC